MKWILAAAGVVVVGSTLAGCGPILGSAGGKLPARGGSAYSLPKALLDVKLSDSSQSGDLVLTIGDPVYIADERYTYFLQYKPNPFASDTAELTIDPRSNLLQTVNGTAEDKTSEVIVELAKAAAMIAQAAAGEEIVIFERKIDPADDAAVAALVSDMNMVATGHAARMYVKSNCTDADKTDKCTSYRMLQRGANIYFSVRKPAPLDAEPANCAVGVCYRAPAPYGIEFAFNGQYRYGTVVNLPNDRPALVLPLDRTIFAKRVDNAEFENGMLKKAHFEKPSEALAIASLPETVMTEIFKSISNLIQAKIEISDKEKGLAQSEAALLQAQKDLQDKQVAVRQSAAARQTNVLLSGSSSGLRFAPKVGEILVPQPQPVPPVGLGGGLTSPSNPGNLPPFQG